MLRKIVSGTIYVVGFAWGFISTIVDQIKQAWKNRS